MVTQVRPEVISALARRNCLRRVEAGETGVDYAAELKRLVVKFSKAKYAKALNEQMQKRRYARQRNQQAPAPAPSRQEITRNRASEVARQRSLAAVAAGGRADYPAELRRAQSELGIS